jgi:hypothetical protein
MLSTCYWLEVHGPFAVVEACGAMCSVWEKGDGGMSYVAPATRSLDWWSRL